jgi:hypothetical protein
MRKLLVLLSLAALFFAGCGGGDDDTSSTDASAGASSDATTTSAADTDFSGKGSGDFCDLARQYEKDFKDTGDANTKEEIKKEYTDLASAIDKLVSKAPSEIKPDAQTVNEKFKKVTALFAKYDYDFSKIPESEAANMSLDDPAFTASSNRIESYFEKVCKIDSDEDGDTDGIIKDDSSTSDTEQAPDTTGDGSTGGSSDTTATTEG